MKYSAFIADEPLQILFTQNLEFIPECFFLLSLQNGGSFFLKRLQLSKEHHEAFFLQGN